MIFKEGVLSWVGIKEVMYILVIGEGGRIKMNCVKFLKNY